MRNLKEAIKTLAYNSGEMFFVGYNQGEEIGRVKINDLRGCQVVPRLLVQLSENSGKRGAVTFRIAELQEPVSGYLESEPVPIIEVAPIKLHPLSVLPDDTKFSGNKYHRMLLGLCGEKVVTDVYRVLSAFNVTSPPIQHGIKKLLCAGIRGKGNEVQDLEEARDCITARLLELKQINDGK